MLLINSLCFVKLSYYLKNTFNKQKTIVWGFLGVEQVIFDSYGNEDRCEFWRWRMEDGRWKMGDGRWKLEDGSWKLGVGSWKLESGSWKLEDGSWELEVGIWDL